MALLRHDALGKLLLRLSLGGLMLFHGVAKIANPDSLNFIGAKLVAAGMPAELAWGVYIGELLAPLMIVFGVFSRLGGLIIVVNMLFAIGLAHAGELMSLGKHGGWALELQGFYLFCGLAMVFLGSGRWAVRPD